MPGHVDDVIHASENAEIAVSGEHGSIGRKIGPVAPIFAAGILAVFPVVLGDETIAIAPDGLHDPGPGIPYADVAGLVRSSRDLLPVFVNNHRIDSRHTWARASRLHGIDRRLGAAEESSVFSLPPGVDNHCLTFAHNVVIPAPDLGLDGFADCGHVLEMVVVLGGFIVTGFRSEER